MKDLLEIARSFYSSSARTPQQIADIQRELEKLDYYSQGSWIPFWAQVRFSEPFRIARDLFYVEEIVETKMGTIDRSRLSSELIRRAIADLCKSNDLSAQDHVLLKSQVLVKYAPKQSAVFLFKQIKREFYMQRRRWLTALLAGWFLGLLTAVATALLKVIASNPDGISAIKSLFGHP